MIDRGPEYWQTEHVDNFADSPERKLLVGILAVAVNDANGFNRKHKARALAWIADDTAARPPCDVLRFPVLCDYLGLDPESVRRAVLSGTARRHIPLGGSSGRECYGETTP